MPQEITRGVTSCSGEKQILSLSLESGGVAWHSIYIVLNERRRKIPRFVHIPNNMSGPNCTLKAFTIVERIH